MLEKIREILADQFNVDPEEITEDTNFNEDLGADSLDLFEMVIGLEDEYQIEFPAEDLTEIATVGDVINYLKEKGVEI